MAYPSLDEGFGLPVLEAMACGTPVLTSTKGALVEVAGDAAVLVDPTSEIAIAEGLARLLGDTQLWAKLRAAGIRRAEQYSWRRVGDLAVAAYTQAAQSRDETALRRGAAIGR